MQAGAATVEISIENSQNQFLGEASCYGEVQMRSIKCPKDLKIRDEMKKRKFLKNQNIS